LGGEDNTLPKKYNAKKWDFTLCGFDFFLKGIYKTQLPNALIKKIITILYQNKNPLNLLVYCNFKKVRKAYS